MLESAKAEACGRREGLVSDLDAVFSPPAVGVAACLELSKAGSVALICLPPPDEVDIGHPPGSDPETDGLLPNDSWFVCGRGAIMAFPDCKKGAINPSILAWRWNVGCEGVIHGFSRHHPNGIDQHYAERSAVTARFPAMEVAKSDSGIGCGHRLHHAKGR